MSVSNFKHPALAVREFLLLSKEKLKDYFIHPAVREFLLLSKEKLKDYFALSPICRSASKKALLKRVGPVAQSV